MALFNFTIHYQTGRSNKATDALSRHPHTERRDKKLRGAQTTMRWKSSCTHSVCEVVDEYLNTTKVLDDLKKEALSISCAVQSLVEEEDVEQIQGMLNSVSVLNQITPEDMVEEQKRYLIL